MTVTFITGKEEQKLKRSAIESFNSITEDLKSYALQNNREEALEYALEIDYISPKYSLRSRDEDEDVQYLRYQISYGGPSEEIRFHIADGCTSPWLIEYVYLDWGAGIGFDITNRWWAKWLFNVLKTNGFLYETKR